MTRMYPENRKTLNWFVGCKHDCLYCRPSFQRQMKRQKQNCMKCYRYQPHAHLERFEKSPPKTEGNQFVFFPSSGDPFFASREEFGRALEFAEKYSNRTFLIQSKNPFCFVQFEGFPDNVILGTTVETTLIDFPENPSKYESYDEISHAPHPLYRLEVMAGLDHKRKEVTIEPILAFRLPILVEWVQLINPEFVYVGYDNHNCHLPEPRKGKTEELIKELEKFTEVRVKSLRRAWYEGKQTRLNG